MTRVPARGKQEAADLDDSMGRWSTVLIIHPRFMRSLFLILVLAASTAGGAVAQSTIEACRFDTSLAATKPLEELISLDDPVAGNPEGEVMLVEFFDPNCIHCRGLEPIMAQVMDVYGERIRYYKKPFALSQHSYSQIGAMLIADEMAGKFYEMAARQLTSDAFPYLSNEEMVAIAEDLGLDGDAFYDDLIEGAYMNRVQFLRNQARHAGIRGTPTLLINSAKQSVAPSSRSYECIASFVEAELLP